MQYKKKLMKEVIASSNPRPSKAKNDFGVLVGID